MNKSEQLCEAIGRRFFCRDFVFNNLKKHITSNNKRVELCDALFECCNNYLIFQIKERNVADHDEGKTEEEWFSKAVLEKAVKQISDTINYLNNDKVLLKDCYNQQEALDREYSIYPIILFDNNKIKDYTKFIDLNGTLINIFSLEDFEKLINSFVHPREVTDYLNIRVDYFTRLKKLPGLLIEESGQSTFAVNITSEADLFSHFHLLEYSFDKNKIIAANKMMNIIELYRNKMLQANVNYKGVLRILMQIMPNDCHLFLDRYFQTIEDAKNNVFRFSRSLILPLKKKDTVLLFLSSSKEKPLTEKHISIIADSKLLQHKKERILIMYFSIFDGGKYDLNWILYEKKLEYSEEAYTFYKELGFYNGSASYEILNKLATYQ